MNDWQETTLDEVCEYRNEKIVSSDINISDYISTENMLPNIQGVTKATKLPTSKIAKYKKGDILLSNIRPYFKKIWYSNRSGGCSTDVLVFKNKNNINSKFLFYILSQQNFFDYVMAGSKGTKMPRGDKNNIINFKIKLPPLQEQKAISSILSALDDKIEINNKINETLEEMAQALFKRWFVDFNFPDDDGKPYKDNGGEMVESELGMIPKGFEVKEISKVSKDIICGKTPSTKDKSNYGNEINFITIPDLHNKVYVVDTNKYLSLKGAESQYKKYIPKNAICISCIGTVGLVSLAMRKSQTNQQINTVIALDKQEKFMFFKIRSLSDTIKLLSSGGTTINNLNKEQFSKILLDYPSINQIEKYNELVEEIFLKIENVMVENKNLKGIRDTLLPKLMSGEVRVKY